MKRLMIIISSSILLLLIVIQFIRVKKVTEEFLPSNDFLMLSTPPPEVAKLFRSACYDCHSYETIYPWYFKIAPVSWMIKNHISEARENLNFSDWGSNSKDEQNDILKACSEEIGANEMPLFSYKIMHPLSRLDAQEKTLISNWIISFIAINNDLQQDTSEN